MSAILSEKSSKQIRVALRVNGEIHELLINPNRTLLEVLRQDKQEDPLEKVLDKPQSHT